MKYSIKYSPQKRCWVWEFKYQIDGNTTCHIIGHELTRKQARARLAYARAMERDG